MNIALFRRAKHRLKDQKPHQGWEGREGEIHALLAPHDEFATTMPIRGLPVSDEELMRDCPVDMCSWPDGVYAARPADQHLRLLQHMHGHNAQDLVRSYYRRDRAIEKLQALT